MYLLSGAIEAEKDSSKILTYSSEYIVTSARSTSTDSNRSPSGDCWMSIPYGTSSFSGADTFSRWSSYSKKY